MGISLLYTYTSLHNFESYWNKLGKEICLPNKEYIFGHRYERINMFVKYIVHMHIVVLFTEWTLAAQTVDQTVRKSYGTKSSYHF